MSYDKSEREMHSKHHQYGPIWPTFMIHTPPVFLNSSTNIEYSRGNTNVVGMKSYDCASSILPSFSKVRRRRFKFFAIKSFRHNSRPFLK